jgi:predicted glycosyltransferase
MKPSLFFYCQHSMGLGHLVRSWAIADALSSSFHVVFVSGGESPAGMEPPAAVEMVTLPALEQTTAGDIVTRGSDEQVADIQMRRRRLLVDTFVATRPAVVVIELFPFGRAKFAGEILPILDYAATLVPRPVVVCSIRDLLAGGRKNQQRHDDRARAIVEKHFDAVLVHADPRLAALEETFKPATPLQVPVMYTGFVTPRQTPTTTARRDRVGVLVSAGGGRYGGPLFRAAVDAHLLYAPVGRLPMRIITGPFLPQDEYAELERRASGCGDLTIERSVPSLRPALESSRVSISQCGYNTALDLLQAGLPALVVPFAEGGEDEQRARARRLEVLGALRVLDPDALTGPRLAHELLATRRFTPAPIALDLDGARETLGIVTRLHRSPVPDGVREMECA